MNLHLFVRQVSRSGYKHISVSFIPLITTIRLPRAHINRPRLGRGRTINSLSFDPARLMPPWWCLFIVPSKLRHFSAVRFLRYITVVFLQTALKCADFGALPYPLKLKLSKIIIPLVFSLTHQYGEAISHRRAFARFVLIIRVLKRYYYWQPN